MMDKQLLFWIVVYMCVCVCGVCIHAHAYMCACIYSMHPYITTLYIVIV